MISPAGLDAVGRVTHDLDDGRDELAISTRLRSTIDDADRRAVAISAGVARRRARHRWPDADQLLFTREGLEQASDPEVSHWRARRFPTGSATMDLCAGVGGDTLALGEQVTAVTAVDIDPGRLRLLRHNAAVRGIEVTAIVADALTIERDDDVWVHADPSRRAGTRRLRALRDHQPSVPALAVRHRDAPGSGIVLSPGVDLADPDLPDGELEFVALQGALTEAVMWLGDARRKGTSASATLLPGEHHRRREGDPEGLEVGGIGSHIIEVAAAAVRARLHTEIGAEVGARRIATRRALLTSDALLPVSPWYRSRTVEAVLTTRTKDIRRWLRSADERPLEIATHGLSIDVDQVWRGLGRPPRGPQSRRLDLIRTDDGAVAVLST